MRTLDIDVAYGKINLQCGADVQWNHTFPERIPDELQPYLDVRQEESWNNFSSHQLDVILTQFNDTIHPTLRFHLSTCIFAVAAFIANVVIAITFRRSNWRELYPVVCMVIVFAVLLITQYRTLKIFRQTLDILSNRLEKAIEKTIWNERERRRSRTRGEGNSGIGSFKLVLDTRMASTGTTSTINYIARIMLGDRRQSGSGSESGSSSGSDYSDDYGDIITTNRENITGILPLERDKEYRAGIAPMEENV